MAVEPDTDAGRRPGHAAFDDAALPDALDGMTAAELDALPFGLVTMDRSGRITHYNAAEATRSGLQPDRVVGRNFFTDVGPCTDNIMVAGRYRAASGTADLDEQIDYTFTFGLRVTPVRLRMMRRRGGYRQYLAIRDR